MWGPPLSDVGDGRRELICMIGWLAGEMSPHHRYFPLDTLRGLHLVFSFWPDPPVFCPDWICAWLLDAINQFPQFGLASGAVL